MIKVIKENGKSFVKINDKLHQVIVDKKNQKAFVFYDEKFILTLTLEGRCLKKEPVNMNSVNYMKWNTEICWNPPYYVNNKRSCDGCETQSYCQCSLNIEKFNFGDEKDATKPEQIGTDLPNDRNEDAPHEPEVPTPVQEQSSESRLA